MDAYFAFTPFITVSLLGTVYPGSTLSLRCEAVNSSDPTASSSSSSSSTIATSQENESTDESSDSSDSEPIAKKKKKDKKQKNNKKSKQQRTDFRRGGVITKIPEQSKRLLIYALTLPQRGRDAPPLPVCKMLSNEHSIPPLAFWLMQFQLKLLKHSIDAYLEWTYAMYMKTKPWAEIKGITVLRFLASIGKKTDDKGPKEFFTFVFARLQNTVNVEAASEIFKHFCVVLLARHESTTVLKSRQFLDNLIRREATEESHLIKEATRCQSTAPEWHSLRKERVTASNFQEVIHVRGPSAAEDLAERLIRGTRQTVHMKRGLDMEAGALKDYAILKNLNLRKCGLVIHPDAPWLGASPDGLVYDLLERPSFGLFEIKCPNAVSYIDCTYLRADHGVYKLKESHPYYWQVQGQLLISGIEWCDFVICAHEDMFVQRIYRDTSVLSSLKQRSSD
ncbi:hypothetical protein QQF64_033988 [Cirrhinus molitorella]|uniref:YqaJ viral recombinase domain-containing protein n=1 Tax=Cirrhinus molitorella TaxID=172907 RepID=A0ABR3MVF2_9TELE